MLKKKQKLIMYDAREIEFEEKKNSIKTGNMVKKWKYSFFDKDKNIMEGFDDVGAFKDYAVDIEEINWSDENAVNVTWEVKLFDGKQTNSLLEVTKE